MVELEKEKKAKTAELDSLKENDPQALADLEKELKLVTEAAHRWTDNIFTVRSLTLWDDLLTIEIFYILTVEPVQIVSHEEKKHVQQGIL